MIRRSNFFGIPTPFDRKLIFYEDKLYQKEDNKYSKNQIFKLIKSISENDYSKIDNNTLPK